MPDISATRKDIRTHRLLKYLVGPVELGAKKFAKISQKLMNLLQDVHTLKEIVSSEFLIVYFHTTMLSNF